MSVLVVGISHNSAPVALLERVALDADGVQQADRRRRRLRARHRGDRDRDLQPARDLRRRRPLPRQRRGASRGCSSSAPARPPRRCCRTSTSTTTTAPSPTSSRSPPASTRWPSARARSSARPARRCASGQELGTVGPALNVLFQQALRVGKRSRAETDIDRAAPSLVDRRARPRPTPPSATSPASACSWSGAGAMAGLATATVARLRRRRASPSSTAAADRAARLAAEYGARPAPLDRPRPPSSARADVVITCTGATGVLVTADDGRGRAPRRPPARRSSTSRCPHDVDPAVGRRCPASP